MINIASQPTAGSLQAAYQNIEYVISQSGVSTLLPTALDVDAMDDGTVFQSFPAGISSGSGFGFLFSVDLSGAAASKIDKLAGLPSPISTVVRSLDAAVVKLSANFKEYAPNTSDLLALTGEDETTTECFVIDAYRRAEDVTASLGTYSNFNAPRLLTRRPSLTVLPLTCRDTVTVFNTPYSGTGLASVSDLISVAFEFFDDAGVSVGSGLIELPYPAGSLIQVPIGPADIAALTLTGSPPANLDAISYYTVSVGRQSATPPAGDPELDVTGSVLEVQISRAPCNYTEVYYYNSFGAWELALFEETTTRSHGLTGSQYNRLGSRVTEQRRSRLAVQVTSSTRTAEEADVLLDLANAQLIYLNVNNQLIPVSLDAQTLPIAFGPGSNGQQPFQFTLRALAETRSQRSY